MGKFLSSEWPLLLLIIGSLAAGAALYPQLPERVPSHWNFRGEVDGYSSRFWGAFGIPLMTAGIYVMMLVLPLIDPRRQNYQKFAGVYRLFRAVMVIFMTGLYAVVLLSALGHQIAVDRITMAGISLLFVVLGNFMGQIRHNYFVGIKTPWTLADEQVWQKTHRLGGRLWVAAGLVGLAASLIGGAAGGIVLAVSLGTATIIPVVYSYLVFRRGGNKNSL
ncbi:predicted integral membrane protein [Pelotomaculum thermopropionicum SI]|uniref:Predicted integral membrane protein n=1 Tax=Pelotomaculum thermopropionicum (strain DSM 13744 / JCM 10971 / SI) TaxID=370438 RepID=A5D244_PELTS|nr:predicted integral membrane protein [Pelotomaculum thermopropionicum SI]